LPAALEAIERRDAGMAYGEGGAYGRQVSVHLLQAEVRCTTCSRSGPAVSARPW
jgi:hypothetical protein